MEKGKGASIMRVLVTVSSIQNESAGPSYTVPALCSALQLAGADVSLYTLGGVPRKELKFNVRAFPYNAFFLLRWLGWSRSMLHAFREESDKSDVFHVNGTWMFPQVYPSIAAKGRRAKVVYCPRGGLSKVTFARHRPIKWFFWNVCGQKRALEAVSMFHAASKKEYEEIRACGFRQPVAIIPNGVDVPSIDHEPYTGKKRKIAFFGRIHPTKVVDHLVVAWGNVANHFPDWELQIAGPDCGAMPMLEAMIAERNIPRVSFTGELHGMEKYKFLASADLYVLPSLTENFGITIAEALACGTPVIASKGCPWSGLVEKSCGWWIDIGADALTAKLKEALTLPPQVLKEMGERGRGWMASDYSWESIGRKMLVACEWLTCPVKHEKPEFVLSE